MNKLPQAKTENIVVQDLDSELLIYNLTTHQAFTLNKTLKNVYQSCDGNTTFDELKRRHKFTDDLIHLALDELKACDLLVDYTSNHFVGLSRRDVFKRVGLASMVALPVITGLVAPSATSAASGATLNNACQSSTDCGTDAPYCTELVSGGRACCVIGAAFLASKGSTQIGREYASCNDCLAANAIRCCSGRVTNTSCSGANNGDCTSNCA